MRAGVLQLDRWGCSPTWSPPGHRRSGTTAFHYADGETVEVALRATAGVEALYAPRRLLLDRILVDAAAAAGVEVRHETTITSLLCEGGRVAGVRVRDAQGRERAIRATVTVGADGVRSTVAAQTGAPVVWRARSAGRGAVPLLRRPADGRLRVGVRRGRRRRADPHQRRADLRLRRHLAGADAGRCGPRVSQARSRHCWPSRSRRCRPGWRPPYPRAVAGLACRARVSASLLGAGVGARRGCGLLQGPDHHARHHRQPPRRRAARRRARGLAGRQRPRAGGPRGLPVRARPDVDPALLGDRGGRGLRLGHSARCVPCCGRSARLCVTSWTCCRVSSGDRRPRLSVRVGASGVGRVPARRRPRPPACGRAGPACARSRRRASSPCPR